MARRARVAAALLIPLVAIGCGSSDSTFPRDRAPVRVVGCRPAPPPPTLAAELFETSRDVADLLRADTERLGTKPKLRLSISDVTIDTGTYDAALVRKGLQPRLADLQACYARDTASASVKAKSLKLQFTITTSGSIALPREIADGRITTPPCIRSVLSAVTLGSPRAGSVLATVGLRVNLPETAADPGTTAGSAGLWTPFALDGAAPTEAAAISARGAESALRGRLSSLGACFPANAPTGSIRVLLDLGEDGVLLGLRAGGLGNKAVEDCVRTALFGLTVPSPVSDPAEIACDVSRGDAEPWHVAPDAGYHVIAVSKTKVVYGTTALAAGSPAPEPLDRDGAYLLVLEPDATGAMVSLALTWAYEGAATLVTLREPKRQGPPRFLGMGYTSGANGDADEDPAIMPALRLGAATVTACVNRTTQTAKLADPSLVTALLGNIAAKCKSVDCARTLVLAMDADARAYDLLEVTGSARRAGFERVLIGTDLCGGSSLGKPEELEFPDDEL